MGSALKEVLITAEQLQTRIGELAAQIDADYAGRDLLLVGVLKGAVMVLADLAAGDLVLAACSGGADSLALAVALAFVAPRASPSRTVSA